MMRMMMMIDDENDGNHKNDDDANDDNDGNYENDDDVNDENDVIETESPKNNMKLKQKSRHGIYPTQRSHSSKFALLFFLLCLLSSRARTPIAQ